MTKICDVIRERGVALLFQMGLAQNDLDSGGGGGGGGYLCEWECVWVCHM